MVADIVGLAASATAVFRHRHQKKMSAGASSQGQVRAVEGSQTRPSIASATFLCLKPPRRSADNLHDWEVAMPVAIDAVSRASTNHHKNKPRRPALTNTVSVNTNHEKSQALDRLRNLLISAPIDLSGISDEIRRHPDLESLVLRLSVSLVLSPDDPLSTVEEAVVVLGTSRLRVLIDLWSSSDSRPVGTFAANSQLPSGESASLSGSPEADYLSNFLLCLESDSSGNGERLAAWASKIPTDQLHTLTDLFMRDFFSLLPVIQPTVRQ